MVRHTPVLLEDVIACLEPRPGDFVIDATLGDGGHAAAIAKRITPSGTLLGIDWDPDSLAAARERVRRSAPSVRTICLWGNYADLPSLMRRAGVGKANGALFDLGISSAALERSGRGFSFLRDEPLRMTYDPSRTPLMDLLPRMSEEDLERVIREYGGERMAKRVARALKSRLRERPIVTSGELAAIVRGALPRRYERGRIDPATRTFQALRIHANDELKNVARAIANLPRILAAGGRAVLISFHSREDRIVKRGLKGEEDLGNGEILTTKPITASLAERRANPRSRSAKLRAIRMKGGDASMKSGQ